MICPAWQTAAGGLSSPTPSGCQLLLPGLEFSRERLPQSRTRGREKVPKILGLRKDLVAPQGRGRDKESCSLSRLAGRRPLLSMRRVHVAHGTLLTCERFLPRSHVASCVEESYRSCR